jgi:hypothetical protein
MAYVLVPFGVLSLGQIRQGHLFAFFVVSFAVLVSLQKSQWLRAFLWYFAGWYVVARLRLVFDHRSLDAMIGAKLADPHLLYFMFGLALFYVITQTSAPVESFYNAICILTIFQVTIGAFQAFDIFPFFFCLEKLGLPLETYKVSPMIFGTLQNPNFLAMMIAISFPFFLRRHWFWFTPALMAMLFYLKTSTAIIGLACALVVFCWDFWPLRYCVAGIGISALTAYILLVDSHVLTDVRLDYWRKAIELQGQSIGGVLFGNGPGSYLSREWTNLHNDWLRIIFEYGACGLLLIVGYVRSLTRENRILYSALAGGMVCMLGLYPLSLAPSAFLLIMILALLEREKWQTI